jgi:hypothetical protein
MCPGPSRTTRRPRNRTRLPSAREPVPRPGRPGTMARARRRRPSRHPRPGTAPRHPDRVPAVRPRPNGARSHVPAVRPRPNGARSHIPAVRPRPNRARSHVPPRARPARPPRPLASPASRSPRPAGRFHGPGGLASLAMHGEASRQRIQNARRETQSASPHPGAGRPSASGCGVEGHTGADRRPRSTANHSARAQRRATQHRSAASYPAAGYPAPVSYHRRAAAAARPTSRSC